MPRKKKTTNSKISNYTTKQQLNIMANSVSNLKVEKNYSSPISNYTTEQQLNILANSIEDGGGGGGSAVLETLNVTQNGTYKPSTGVDGYNVVNVDVDTGAEVQQPINPNGYMRSCTLEGYDVNHILNSIDATNSFNTQFSYAFNSATCNNCDIDTSIIVNKFANKTQGFDTNCFKNSTGWNKFYFDGWNRNVLCLPGDAVELKISNYTGSNIKVFDGSYKNIILNTPLSFQTTQNVFGFASTVQSLTFENNGYLGTLYDREYTYDLSACSWTVENMMNTLTSLAQANSGRTSGYNFNIKFSADKYAELQQAEGFNELVATLTTEHIAVKGE